MYSLTCYPFEFPSAELSIWRTDASLWPLAATAAQSLSCAVVSVSYWMNAVEWVDRSSHAGLQCRQCSGDAGLPIFSHSLLFLPLVTSFPYWDGSFLHSIDVLAVNHAFSSSIGHVIASIRRIQHFVNPCILFLTRGADFSHSLNTLSGVNTSLASWRSLGGHVFHCSCS